MYFLATEVCDTPPRGAELDLLNDLVASTVMSIVRFIDDFRRRAEAAPVIPSTAGERDFVPLIRELMEQGNRSVLLGISTGGPVPSGVGAGSITYPEVI